MTTNTCLMCGASLRSIESNSNRSPISEYGQVIGYTQGVATVEATRINGCHTHVTAGPTGYTKYTSPKPKTEAELDFEWQQAREKGVSEASKVFLTQYSKAAQEPTLGVQKHPDMLYPSSVVTGLYSKTRIHSWKAELVGSQFVVEMPKRPRANSFTGLVVKA